MEYTRVKPEDIVIGNKINFGDGDINTIVDFTESTYKVSTKDNPVPHHDRLVVLKDKLGIQHSVYFEACVRGAILELDETIMKCHYCGKLRPANEMKRAEIWVNGWKRGDNYCFDTGCASYAQMSAEG